METEELQHLRHSLAHLLAAAVLQHYPTAKRAIGPAIDNGFYFDFKFDTPISDADLPKIEATMRELLPAFSEFKKIMVPKTEALKHYEGNPYKCELIEEFSQDGSDLSFYQTGTYKDLCKGGHSDSIADIDPQSFKLTHIAGAYWRGNEKNDMLTRIYGLAFETKDKLDAHVKMREEAKARDHKKLGPDLDLFFIDEKVGRGLPMWTPKGTAIKFALESFTRDLERKYDYEHVSTPYLGAEELYRTSGHLDHYKSNMYAALDMDGDIFYLRPMACPHHIRMFQRKVWSYKDLPIRYAEIADYNRYEKSGELMGMIRVRKFQLTDAHIFVSKEGLKEEFKRVCQMIIEGMTGIGLIDVVSYRFSKRDPKNKEKYFPDDELWNTSEKLMKEALDEIGITYTEAEDEAAFYGPKLDIQARNVNGKEDTLFTAQMDFLLPQKFDLEYVNSEGKKERPVMIHRSTIGCLERTFAFLIEHFGGAFPLWMSPVQVRVLPVSESQVAYAKTIFSALKEANIRVELDDSNESLGKKIRATKLEKIPYFLVVGDKEVTAQTATVESRDKGQLGPMPLSDILSLFAKEIKDRA